jgi:hypothetical protein
VPDQEDRPDRAPVTRTCAYCRWNLFKDTKYPMACRKVLKGIIKGASACYSNQYRYFEGDLRDPEKLLMWGGQ